MQVSTTSKGDEVMLTCSIMQVCNRLKPRHFDPDSVACILFTLPRLQISIYLFSFAMLNLLFNHSGLLLSQHSFNVQLT